MKRLLVLGGGMYRRLPVSLFDEYMRAGPVLRDSARQIHWTKRAT